MTDFPTRIRINEEGPREGFQIESAAIPTAEKIALIEALSETGVHHIQAVSFVNPKKVPGWADADAVLEGLRSRPGVEYSALWLNPKGFERALAHRDKLSLTASIKVGASEAFMKLNQNTDLAGNLAMQRRQVAEYLAHRIPVTSVGITATFGCNFQGAIPTSRVLEAIGQGFAIGAEQGIDPDEIRLVDTMAWATPDRIKRTISSVRERYPDKILDLHLHDTRGMAIANAFAALELGVASFDSAVAGLGGCPFAGHAGAAGNICTEDLVFLAAEMGIETGIDLERLIEAARLAERIVGHPLPGSVMHGGSLARFRKAA